MTTFRQRCLRFAIWKSSKNILSFSLAFDKMKMEISTTKWVCFKREFRSSFVKNKFICYCNASTRRNQCSFCIHVVVLELISSIFLPKSSP